MIIFSKFLIFLDLPSSASQNSLQQAPIRLQHKPIDYDYKTFGGHPQQDTKCE